MASALQHRTANHILLASCFFIMLILPAMAIAGNLNLSATEAPAPVAANSTVLHRSPATPDAEIGTAIPASQNYVVLGWNNLGMHCYNPDFSNLMILPPYNTLVSQVVKRGDPPQIVTSGVHVHYQFPLNTYSAGKAGLPNKTNFWQYAPALFGVNLRPNTGLTGKRLTGTMDAVLNKTIFRAEGIPLTEINDKDTSTMTPYPFQKAKITVRDINETPMASLWVVAPVSTELSCENCHADTMDATTRYAPFVQPTGKVETNILTLHDYLNKIKYATYLKGRPDLLNKTPLIDNQPVMCANCHGDAALGTPKVGSIKNLSNAMHGHHNPVNVPDITPDTAGCYNCHPGQKTQCLRDTMSQNLSLQCTDCHGNITKVAKNPQPWLREPKCSNAGCHGAGYATGQQLFQNSVGHGGLYCEACHDSTHAIATSREPNDAIKFRALQGHTGTLDKCTVCHATKPLTMFNHTPRAG